MNRAVPFLLGFLLLLIIAAAQPSPFQRNQFSTNVLGEPIYAPMGKSNAVEISQNSATGIVNWMGTNGVIGAMGGFQSFRSNTIAPTSFTFPATTVNWTNPLNCNIEVYVDNSGVTGTSFKKNGTQIFSILTDITVGLQPGEFFSETFTIGTPSGRYSPH